MSHQNRPKKWNDVSLELIKDPDNFQIWQKLIESAEYNDRQGISKSTSPNKLNQLRISYEKFLDKYPLSYIYWIKYADWEFKLGNTELSLAVYERSFTHLKYCIELWISFLKFKINTIGNNEEEILGLFEKARGLIGYHFYAYEFYNLYLSFLENYSTEENQFKRKYYILLRLILEIPLYHYEYFFRKYFDVISQLNDPKFQEIIKYIVPERDQKKNPKILAVQLKKLFIDAYITTQFKVYELYQFEKKITKHFNDFKFISRQNLDNWNLYFDFLQLKQYPFAYIEMNYWRFVYITCAYPSCWIKLSDFYNYHLNYNISKQVLIRGWKITGNYKILIKLIDLELFMKQYLRAKDLILNYLKYNISIPIPIYEKLINIERIFNKDDDHLIEVFRMIIQDTQNDWFFNVLTYYSINNDKKLKLLEEFKEFKGQLYYDKVSELLSPSRITPKISDFKEDYRKLINN
ncbi:uncharacterized protein KGF55_004004 [Candida pseudojiufengensis]|uniref:uncharacterized protein n=1 Tax=Candida pseudojiufengensis TaxID=497109 RepID=UPI002224ED6E|nr:uncharacterized protein KGF55_004004 [Candida pseudojiufengensis]KAI5961381.1 hypothetical protein KGF55_004004 [Candida pseudojiufengensis]